MRFLKVLATFFCIIHSLDSLAQNQSAQTFFGKNRVQYRDIDWQYYRTRNFDVYFYTGGREIAQYVSREADKIIRETEDFLNYHVDGRFQFIVYNNPSDLQQTNLGLDLDQYNTGGLTRIYGNKVLLYFSGSRNELQGKIKSGIARVVINDMLYGGNIQEKLQNSTMISLPDWYTNGLFTYLEKDWSTRHDEKLRAYFLSKKVKKFNQLIYIDPNFAGNSMWFFLAENYGEASLSNVIYLTRVNRSLDEAIRYVYSKSLKELSKEWFLFYRNRYLNEKFGTENIEYKDVEIPYKKSQLLSSIKISPDTRYYLYTTHKNSLNRLWLYDTETKKRTLIKKTGVKYNNQLGDVKYPIFTWHPSSKSFVYFYDKNGRMQMATARLQTEGKIDQIEGEFNRFDQVFSLEYSPDGQNIAVAAARQGQSDIFILHAPSKRVTSVTQDHFDDFSPSFVKKGQGIAFSSTRPTDTLIINISDSIKQQSYQDLYVWFSKNREKVYRVTQTPIANESEISNLNSQYFAFLSDENGVWNRKVARFDSIPYYLDTVLLHRDTVVASPTSDVRNGIFTQSYNARKSEMQSVFHSVSKTKIVNQFFQPDRFEKLVIKPLSNSIYALGLKRKEGEFNQQNLDAISFFENQKMKLNDSIFNLLGDTINLIKDTTTLDFKHYTFEVETDVVIPIDKDGNTQNVEKNLVPIDLEANKDPFRYAKAKFYTERFGIDYIVSQVGSSLIQQNIPTFIISTANNLNQRPGLVFMAGASDLFENYKFTGGMLLSTTFTNNQYFFIFENLKKRIDKRFVFNQQRQVVTDINTVRKINNIELMSSFVWPFNPFSSIKLNTIYRKDIVTIQSTDLVRLNAPSQQRDWAGLRLEYIFDNSKTVQLNIMKGTRYKVFAETYKNFSVSKDGMLIVGADFRHYQPIHKQFIWANRGVFNASMGPSNILYYLGGVDNWVLSQFDNTLAQPANYNFAFEALATNVRGFKQNARNGSNYLLWNSELRLPIISYLSKSPISSDFLRNFQIISFWDAGTAWTGFNPFGNANPFNIQEYINGPVKVTVQSNKQPMIFGYGLGVRSRLFGYFVRADYAWGVDNGYVQSPMFYLSLSTDF